MSQTKTLQYTLNQATINLEDVEDDEVREALESALDLCQQGEATQAIAALPEMFFEFNAENMDSDFSDYLSEPSVSLTIDPAADNCNVELSCSEDGQLQISFVVNFEVELNDDVDVEGFQSWLDDDGGWMACTATGDWSYADDQGGSLVLLESIE